MQSISDPLEVMCNVYLRGDPDQMVVLFKKKKKKILAIGLHLRATLLATTVSSGK